MAVRSNLQAACYQCEFTDHSIKTSNQLKAIVSNQALWDSIQNDLFDIQALGDSATETPEYIRLCASVRTKCKLELESGNLQDLRVSAEWAQILVDMNQEWKKQVSSNQPGGPARIKPPVDTWAKIQQLTKTFNSLTTDEAKVSFIESILKQRTAVNKQPLWVGYGWKMQEKGEWAPWFTDEMKANLPNKPPTSAGGPATPGAQQMNIDYAVSLLVLVKVVSDLTNMTAKVVFENLGVLASSASRNIADFTADFTSIFSISPAAAKYVPMDSGLSKHQPPQIKTIRRMRIYIALAGIPLGIKNAAGIIFLKPNTRLLTEMYVVIKKGEQDVEWNLSAWAGHHIYRNSEGTKNMHRTKGNVLKLNVIVVGRAGLAAQAPQAQATTTSAVHATTIRKVVSDPSATSHVHHSTANAPTGLKINLGLLQTSTTPASGNF
jgi:hypothetical protein